MNKFEYHKHMQAGKALTDAEYRVLAVLWDYADENRHNARPGYERLAMDCGMSLSKIERTMRQLIAKGWVHQDQRALSGGRGTGGAKAAVFSLRVPEAAQSPVTFDGSLRKPSPESPVKNDGSLPLNDPSKSTESPVKTEESPVKTERMTRHSYDGPTDQLTTDQETKDQGTDQGLDLTPSSARATAHRGDMLDPFRPAHAELGLPVNVLDAEVARLTENGIHDEAIRKAIDEWTAAHYLAPCLQENAPRPDQLGHMAERYARRTA